MAENTSGTLSDEELIRKITQTNDTHLFGVLYDRYAGIVYNKCIGFMASHETAQDLTQDIFVKLFVKLKSFNGESKFSTWLYAFTYNHCVNYIQRELKGKKGEFSVNEDIEDEVPDEVSDQEIFEMKAQNLKAALALIHPEEKAILLMKYQDNIAVKDIAAAMELGESAVKMRLMRAKANLVKKYNSL